MTTLAPLYLASTEDTPKITLDAQKGVFEMVGNFLPEDSMEIYVPVMDWFKAYVQNPLLETNFRFQIFYTNSVGYGKFLLDILKLLETIEGVNVRWYYPSDDEDIREAGEEFAELVKVAFEYFMYEDGE